MTFGLCRTLRCCCCYRGNGPPVMAKIGEFRPRAASKKKRSCGPLVGRPASSRKLAVLLVRWNTVHESPLAFGMQPLPIGGRTQVSMCENTVLEEVRSDASTRT
jgi:hypothetical protein